MGKQQQEDYKFAGKWSDRIERFGFTIIPNLILEYQVALKLTASEFTVMCHLLYYRWSSASPYPAVETLSSHIGLSPSAIRGNIRRLERKGILKRRLQTGATTRYDFSILIERLEVLSANSKAPLKKSTQGYQKIDRVVYPKTDTKKDSGNENPRRRLINNIGLVKTADLVKEKHQSLIYKRGLISNDFGKREN